MKKTKQGKTVVSEPMNVEQSAEDDDEDEIEPLDVEQSREDHVEEEIKPLNVGSGGLESKEVLKSFDNHIPKKIGK